MHLRDLANVARWCAWREQRVGDRRYARRTKVPYGMQGGPMKANDPATWVTLAQAEAMDGGMARAAMEHGEADVLHGVGVVLGPLGEGWSLVGLDLDTCLGQSEAGIEPWAARVLQACPTYAEVSPSGTGIKLVFLLSDADAPAVRAALGVGPGQDGRKLGSAAGKGEHPPCIDAYLGRRYFAITWESAGLVDEVGALTPDLAARLMAIARETFGGPESPAIGVQATTIPSNSANFPAGRISNSARGGIDARLAELAAAQPAFAGLMQGIPYPGQRDLSRSGFADAVMRWLVWAGWTPEDAREVMAGMTGARGDDGSTVADWMAEKGMHAGGREFARAWERWSGSGPRHAGVAAPVGAGLGALSSMDGTGAGERIGTSQDAPSPAVSELSGSDDGSGLPVFSDEALARRMAERYASGEGALRYVPEWDRWRTWNGVRWVDDKGSGLRRARVICSEMAPMAGKDAKSVASARTIHAVEGLARVDSRVVAGAAEWDTDPWLLNTPGGVVDLRTGRLRPNEPSLHMSKATAVPYLGAGDADCPLWRSFLMDVMAGSEEMVRFLQRVAGYCLTGDTSEDAFFMFHGGGDNGKSTLVDILLWVMGGLNGQEGGYGCSVDINTFAAKRGEHHLTEFARLKSARLVASDETQEDRGWDEARIKQVTGGSPIVANFMRQDLFTFTPEFKLIVCGNHKPKIRTPDVAFRRRVNLIEFGVRIPEGKKDLRLPDKLRAEGAAILGWMVQGCLQWQTSGLAPPAAVRVSSDRYLEEQDNRTSWFNECVREATEEEKAAAARNPNERERGLFTLQRHLFMSWKQWAESANEAPGSQRAFADWMQAKGYEAKKHPYLLTAIYEGLLRNDGQSPKPADFSRTRGGLGVVPGGKQE